MIKYDIKMIISRVKWVKIMLQFQDYLWMVLCIQADAETHALIFGSNEGKKKQKKEDMLGFVNGENMHLNTKLIVQLDVNNFIMALFGKQLLAVSCQLFVLAVSCQLFILAVYNQLFKLAVF